MRSNILSCFQPAPKSTLRRQELGQKEYFLGGKILRRFGRGWRGKKRLKRKSENFIGNLSALYGMRVTVSGGWFGWVFVWQLAIDNVWPGPGTSGTPGAAPWHAPEHCASWCAKAPEHCTSYFVCQDTRSIVTSSQCSSAPEQCRDTSTRSN